MKKINNYIKISESISTAGQPTKKQFKTIAKDGFDVVINLAMHNKGALKKEDKIVTKNGMLYYHIPITWKEPELDRLKLFIDTLQMLQRANQKVFIHCIMNYRASVFLYKYRQYVNRDKKIKLIAPKEYKPNRVWKKIIELKFKPNR